MQYISLTSTFLRERRIIDTARTELVRRIIPPGIMPTSAATVLITDCCKPACWKNRWLQKSSAPIGKMIIVQSLIMNLKDLRIRELFFLMYLASLLIFAA